MRRKIQKSMIVITMAALMVAYAILLVFEYRQVRDIAMGRLTDEAEYIAEINHAQIMVRSRLGEGTQMEIAFES
ncbi:hypothetical protein [Lachnoclostridium sp. Marseille-P6806]|uniref:hypothetical protein n=1 Tax=Lachnoclostridium sp. Marseille-P6806 TaxID=2364793 RepID=UPI00102F33C4|nr:hypothetical protein [Lachnoclostridium sp. Marseille-P6806]